MVKITIDSLIKEQRNRIPQLKYVPNPPGCIGLAYYYYEESANYQKWLATTSRFIGINFPNDKDVVEFEKVSKEDLSPSQQQELLAILEAFSCLPTIIHGNDSEDINSQKGITVNTNVTNSNRQSQIQEQSMAIDIFHEAIKDDLTGRQIKEIKQAVADNNNDFAKAKPCIIEKLKTFGSDVAANIVANLITNPLIWGSI